MADDRNVLGAPLQACSMDPLTGFYRTGCCQTGPDDLGVHTVCVRTTEEFLSFSIAVGNDLSTPRPEFGFPGLKPGDRWCLCLSRWIEAYDAGFAPPVILEATHSSVLETVPLDVLEKYAERPADLPYPKPSTNGHHPKNWSNNGHHKPQE